jgi:hypothetical protein
MRYVGLAILAALVVAAGASGALQKSGSLHATLTGSAETPKGDPDGHGTAEVKISGRKVCWEIKVSKVQRILAAHIHKGKAGVAGPIVVHSARSSGRRVARPRPPQSPRRSSGTRARTT